MGRFGTVGSLPVVIVVMLLAQLAGGGCGIHKPLATADGGGATGGAPVVAPLCPSNASAACQTTCSLVALALESKCAPCHGADVAAVPGLNVLDLAGLLAVPDAGARYLVPGDPTGSRLFQVAMDSAHPASPIAGPIVASEVSALRDWITSCLGGATGGRGGAGMGGAGGRGAGGRGGEGPGGEGGRSGGGGGGGAPVREASVLACPATAPTGSCATPGQICVYPDQSCVCAGGSWGCVSCPAQPPSPGTSCGSGARDDDGLGGGNPTLICSYADSECTCPGGVTETVWSCGVCPANRPPSSQACGNSSFQCLYPDASCVCSSNGWNCGPLTCPQPVTGPFSCPGFAPLNCAYPIEGQTCRCRPYWSCSCPGTAPRTGAPCVGNPGPCDYPGKSCNCFSRAWSCTVSCPSTAPTTGEACEAELSCTYGATLCHCANARWTCS